MQDSYQLPWMWATSFKRLKPEEMVACPDCARELERNHLLRHIESLQHSIDYAAPELLPYLEARRYKLLARLEEVA